MCNPHGGQHHSDPASLPYSLYRTAPLSGTPAAFHMAGPPQYSGRLDEGLRSMLQVLPTKSDIEALILRIEEAHSHDMHEVKVEVHSLST